MITDEERAKRYETSAEAIASIELEGLTFTENEIEIIRRYVDGEFTLEQAIAQLRTGLEVNA